MIEDYTISHHEHATGKPFEQLVNEFETAIGNAEGTVIADAVAAASTPAEVEKALVELAGPSGIVRLFTFDQTHWLRLYGRSVRSRMYLYSDLSAAYPAMFEQDVRVGLQAPLRLQVFQDPDGTSRVAYDLPSSLLGRLGNEKVDAAARLLDERLVTLLVGLTGASPTVTEYTGRYQEHVSDKTYEQLVADFQTAVGSAEDTFASALAAATSAAEWERYCTDNLGWAGMLRVFSLDHGQLLGRFGADVAAKVYFSGNPLLAYQMLAFDARVGEHIPMHVMIFRGPGGRGHIGYELPTAALARLDSKQFDAATAPVADSAVAFFEQLSGSMA